MDKNKCIQKIWDTEQEILDVIHDICEENSLKYSLAYGTLLGAVRHGGFIPWDDDIDIMMPRADYEKLLEIWDEVAPKGYILQNGRTEKDFTQNFTKVRKDHTTFLQFDFEREKKYHKGIFVDIFPGDRVAPGYVSRKLQYIACAVNLLYSRGFSSGSKGIIGKIEKILLRVSKEKQVKIRQYMEKYISSWNKKKECQYFFPNTIVEAHCYFDANLFDETTTTEFRGKKYQAVANKDGYLKKCFGDYMKLPPEEERVWKHHPIIIDFERNYEEIKE